MTEEFGLRFYYVDTQAFFAAAGDVKGFEFATLDALPHGLPGYSEAAHGLIDRQISRRGVFGEASTEVVGQSNAPRRTGRQLFSGDEAVVESAVYRRRRYTERRRRLPDPS